MDFQRLMKKSGNSENFLYFTHTGIALDKWMKLFYLADIERAVPEARVHKRIIIEEAGVGFICNEPLLLFLSSTFFRQNIDNLIKIWYDVALEAIVSRSNIF